MNDQQIAFSEVDPALGLAIVGISTADSLWHRGMILTDLGRFREAAEATRRAYERARGFGENEMASWIDCWWARALARAGDVAGAPGTDASADVVAALDRAQALVQSTSARSYEPQIHVERARLAALRSDASGALQWLREAHRLFEEMGATGHAERLAEELRR